MSQKELKDIYKRHTHEYADCIELEFKRFLMDGKPTCLSWYGGGGHERMACIMLGSTRFGTQPMCLFTLEKIDDQHNPTKNCPLWKQD